MKKNGLDEQTIQKAIHLLQRTHGSADIDANEVINLILDHAARACFEQQSRVDGLPSLETEASALDDDRESLIVPSHCSAHVQIDPTRRRCGNYDTPQRITTLGDTCSNNGEHQSEEGNTVLDYDNISSEPPGAMASSQLSEVDDNSDDSHDIHESPAILSVRSMGYSDQSIQPALQKLQNRNSEVTGETLMAEIIQFEDPDPIVEEYCRMKDSLTCKVCLMNTVSITLLPCGHLLCLECAKNSSIRSCHICRSPKNKTQNIFFV
ncbi:baculoviral IAP repeat-containing protein 8-like [Pecten maximus]|uniref:baculoviral IAP repeat-containing protein 8-like n=1 Tax=Pecten maximus TaxID=6579 RepID=UPI0014590455|nr:baculoviral IAP repeat-containing protein 8-like [Pecten maximus]